MALIFKGSYVEFCRDIPSLSAGFLLAVQVVSAHLVPLRVGGSRLFVEPLDIAFVTTCLVRCTRTCIVIFRDIRVCFFGSARSSWIEAALRHGSRLEHRIICQMCSCSPERMEGFSLLEAKSFALRDRWRWYSLTFHVFRVASLYQQNLFACRRAVSMLDPLRLAPMCQIQKYFQFRTQRQGGPGQ